MRSLYFIFVGLVSAQYNCPADQCKPPACFCPSKNPPGGLKPSDIPQFVTLTWDDAITCLFFLTEASNLPVVMSVMGNNANYKNPNGCPIAGTFFQVYNQGNEIAVHTMNHVANQVDQPSAGEILGSYKAINAWAGIPKKELLGFRTPFLFYSTRQLKVLRGLGKFLYDSSIPVSPGLISWPFTMDYGIPYDCNVGGGSCDQSFKIPGLWEISMPNMMNDDANINNSMDPLPLPNSNISDPLLPTKDQVVQMWKYNFNRNYNGGRQPFGIFLHASTWVMMDTANRVAALNEFIQWTLSMGDVYWVTNQQLLGWMLNPTNKQGSLTNQALGCATTPVNSNVCDGVSRKGQQCIWSNANTWNGDYRFSSCFSCPLRPPNVTDQGPVPKQVDTNICFVPDDGCPYPSIWDPASCKCVSTARIQGGPAPSRNFVLGAPIPEWVGLDNVISANQNASNPSSALSNFKGSNLGLMAALIAAYYI